MGAEACDELLEELQKLRATGECLIDCVEDVAGSIRYLTNNLLDDHRHPQLADGLRALAQWTSPLARTAATTPDESSPSSGEPVEEVAGRQTELFGEDEELPADAFQGVQAFRQTGVRTVLVVIHKTA